MIVFLGVFLETRPDSPGEPGMQPRDPCRPWRGKLHRVAFEEESGPRVLLKSGPGNRGRSASLHSPVIGDIFMGPNLDLLAFHAAKPVHGCWVMVKERTVTSGATKMLQFQALNTCSRRQMPNHRWSFHRLIHSWMERRSKLLKISPQECSFQKSPLPHLL